MLLFIVYFVQVIVFLNGDEIRRKFWMCFDNEMDFVYLYIFIYFFEKVFWLLFFILRQMVKFEKFFFRV